MRPGSIFQHCPRDARDAGTYDLRAFVSNGGKLLEICAHQSYDPESPYEARGIALGTEQVENRPECATRAELWSTMCGVSLAEVAVRNEKNLFRSVLTSLYRKYFSYSREMLSV